MKKHHAIRLAALAAMLVSSALADVPPEETRIGAPGVLGILLCVLPLAGAACIYFAMRHRRR